MGRIWEELGEGNYNQNILYGKKSIFNFKKRVLIARKVIESCHDNLVAKSTLTNL